MYEVRFYKIKDGMLTYTVGYRSFAFTEAFEYYLQIERLSKEEYNYKIAIPDEMLEQVVRKSDKVVATIINLEKSW